MPLFDTIWVIYTKTSFCTSKINFVDCSLIDSKLIKMHFWALLDQILRPNCILKPTLRQNKIDNFTHLAVGFTHLALGIRHIFGAKKHAHFAKHLFRNGWMGLPPETNDKNQKYVLLKIFIKCKVQNNFLKVPKVPKVPVWEGPMDPKKMVELGTGDLPPPLYYYFN